MAVNKVLYDINGESIIDASGHYPVYGINGTEYKVNKVVYGETALIDITDSTVDANSVSEGKVFYRADGTKAVGTMTGGTVNTGSDGEVDGETLILTQGGGMNTQMWMGNDYVAVTSYTATDATLTIAKTGTYTVTWTGWRNNSGNTAGSQLYINGTAYGSAVTTFTGTYGQVVTLTDVELSQGDVIEVRARARSTSYRMYVSNLVAMQTA